LGAIELALAIDAGFGAWIGTAAERAVSSAACHRRPVAAQAVFAELSAPGHLADRGVLAVRYTDRELGNERVAVG